MTSVRADIDGPTVPPLRPFAGLLLAVLCTACSRAPVEAAAYAGDGVYEGDPPLCFQSRREIRPTPESRFDLLAHFNNTCRYAVKCEIRTDIDDRVGRVALPAHETHAVLIVADTDERDFSLDLHCAWKP